MSTLISITPSRNAAAISPRHPLEPLSADEVRASVELLKQNGKVTPTTRFVSVALKEPPKSRVHESNGEQPAARGLRRPVRQRHQLLLRGRRLAGRRSRSSLEARPRRAADDDHRRAGRVRAGRARQPRVREALKKHYGIDDTQPGDGRYLERGQLRRRGGPHPPARPAALLPAHRPDRQRLRPAHRGPAPGRRSQHDAGDPRRGVRPLAAAAAARPTTPPTALPHLRDDIKPLEITQPEGRASRSRATRCAGRTGASSSASTPARV